MSGAPPRHHERGKPSCIIITNFDRVSLSESSFVALIGFIYLPGFPIWLFNSCAAVYLSHSHECVCGRSIDRLSQNSHKLLIVSHVICALLKSLDQLDYWSISLSLSFYLFFVVHVRLCVCVCVCGRAQLNAFERQILISIWKWIHRKLHFSNAYSQWKRSKYGRAKETSKEIEKEKKKWFQFTNWMKTNAESNAR